ncbi:MAG TPA: hypothetical protein VGG73_16745 [Vicinamibacterales bacterium]|jgi:hypothetical protein
MRALAGASAGLVLCGALWGSLVAPATPSSDVYTLSYFNRSIAVLKATVLGRTPKERAEAASSPSPSMAAPSSPWAAESSWF